MMTSNKHKYPSLQNKNEIIHLVDDGTMKNCDIAKQFEQNSLFMIGMKS